MKDKCQTLIIHPNYLPVYLFVYIYICEKETEVSFKIKSFTQDHTHEKSEERILTQKVWLPSPYSNESPYPGLDIQDWGNLPLRH